eukprot:15448006-Alexandrium_andersonii.AAC.1
MSCEFPAKRAAASLSRSAASLPRPSQIRRSVSSSQRVSSVGGGADEELGGSEGIPAGPACSTARQRPSVSSFHRRGI